MNEFIQSARVEGEGVFRRLGQVASIDIKTQKPLTKQLNRFICFHSPQQTTEKYEKKSSKNANEIYKVLFLSRFPFLS